jgi:hypothetical protein
MTDRLCFHFDFGPDSPGLDQIGLGMPALQYAEMGYAVLPLIRGGKKPHRMLPPDGGVHHATTNPQQVIEWWRQDPAANIGVATGSVSRLCVIDLDVKHGGRGPDIFAQFLAHYRLALPEVPYVITPSGGDHIWLRWPAGLAVPERPGILPGVDVKGDGGLVVASPSMQLTAPMIRPGERAEPVALPYVQASGCPCSAPLAPGWVPQWLASAPSQGAPGHAGEDSSGEAPDLTSLKRTGIPRGQRNQVLYRLACSRYRLLGTGQAGAAGVLDDLRSVWEAGDRADMGWREVLVIAESARRFIERSERNEMTMRKMWIERLAR